MNIFTMFSSSRGTKKITIGNVIKFSNYKSSVLHTELRVSTLVLFIFFATNFDKHRNYVVVLIYITENHLLGNEKGYVGMAKHFSKKYGNKG